MKIIQADHVIGFKSSSDAVSLTIILKHNEVESLKIKMMGCGFLSHICFHHQRRLHFGGYISSNTPFQFRYNGPKLLAYILL